MIPNVAHCFWMAAGKYENPQHRYHRLRPLKPALMLFDSKCFLVTARFLNEKAKMTAGSSAALKQRPEKSLSWTGGTGNVLAGYKRKN